MSPHDLLPWYVNGTLDPGETAEFENHLPSCDTCTRESAVMEQLVSRLRDAGAGALADHPEPSSLLAAVSGEEADVELAPAEARDVRRHLALCFACRTELAWIRGQAVATDGPATAGLPSPSRNRRFTWAALSAAVLILAASLYIARRAESPPLQSSVTRLHLVLSTTRAAVPEAAVSIAPGVDHVTLLLEVDLSPDDFPARLTLATREGKDVLPPVEIEPGDLFRGAYLTILCNARDCPPGDYLATLGPRGGGRPPAEYRFRVVEPNATGE